MQFNDGDTFVLEGTLDVQSEQFFKALPGKVKHGRVYIDFSKVKRINSMGVALILRSFKEIREEKKAEILLAGLAPMHSMLFKMTGVFLLASPLAEATGERT